MIETLANGYSSESNPGGLLNEYQHDGVQMVFKNLCILLHWPNIASALEGLLTIIFIIFIECSVNQTTGALKE